MDIFIHQAHISLHKNNEISKSELYDNIWDFSQSSHSLPDVLEGNIVLHSPPIEFITQFIQAIVTEKYPQLKYCIIITTHYKENKKAIKQLFHTLKAAGGLVTQQDKYLLIYRLGKWDLPKGKAEKGETIETTAIREVEEECNVTVELQDFLCTTWHYYPQRGKAILKRTDWYAMKCIDDSKATPQVEEDIERVEWLQGDQLKDALTNTYDSILFVFQSFWNKPEQKSLNM
ncbi:hypothetical protein BKI52_25470 [marine bacterium AO1-C]|nr:hypothetical protein BKI52_25470 [marine bacterium AO1-C]